jgi:hypothetical protein
MGPAEEVDEDLARRQFQAVTLLKQNARSSFMVTVWVKYHLFLILEGK